MTHKYLAAAIFAAFGLSACGAVDVSTRSLSPTDAPAANRAATTGPIVLRRAYTVQAVSVSVPETLRVSEANLYFPIADIVWRGEARGDRYAQVKALFENGFAEGTRDYNQGPAVLVDAEVQRFHAVTEKARVTVGGVYSIRFLLTVRDAGTGAVISGPRLVKADLRASGGRRAFEEEASGYTQKVAVTQHLAAVIARELGLPAELEPVPDEGAPVATSRLNFRPGSLIIE